MSPPDYDANLVPAPSLTREFEAIPGYHETQVRAAFKARYSKAVEEIVKDIAPTDFRCLFVSTKENFSVRTNQRGSNMQGGTRTVAGAVAGIRTQTGSSPSGHSLIYTSQLLVSWVQISTTPLNPYFTE
jgi:hypothetical protein